MTRHAKNCTAGAVYTHNERKRDAAESGFGTNVQRLGKDSIKSFDCCSLTLQPCRNPVITKDGFLFDKEAILQYIITKKNEYSRKLKEYERLKSAENAALNQEKNKQIVNQSVKNFLVANKAVDLGIRVGVASNSKKSSTFVSSISNMANGNEKKLPSFWIPSESPNAGLAKLNMPDPKIYCPVSQKPLKVKDLIDIKFTLLKDGDGKQALITKDARYMCPVTHDILNNSIPCAVLRPTGDVVTMECVEKLIIKDMVHPLTNKKLTEKDIIPMQRGGTGYSITNTQLKAVEKRPVLQV